MAIMLRVPPCTHIGGGSRRKWVTPPPAWRVTFPMTVLPFSLTQASVGGSRERWTSSEAFFLLHLAPVSGSQCIARFEWEGGRCLILMIVLRGSVFHRSDILDDNSSGQAGQQITFLRLAPAAAFIRRWSLVPLHSITLQFEGESLWWRRKIKTLGSTLFYFKAIYQGDSSVQI